MRIIAWFSCGVASATACAMTLLDYPDADIRILRCVVDNEHEDNDRFHADCERLFGRQIERIKSSEFKDCWEVWEKRQYLAGIKGAPCTVEMKKVPRFEIEREWFPDAQVYGYTADENHRVVRFRENNPDVRLLVPLIESAVDKGACHAFITASGIELPVMYRLGFANNNCICCVKATSIIYWARCRHYFPEQFARMVALSRRFKVRLTRLKGKRIYIDEIPADIDWRKRDKENVECGLQCVGSR